VGDITPLLGVSILPCPIQVLPDVLGDGIVFHGVEDQQHLCKVNTVPPSNSEKIIFPLTKS
jgi:hypothetical protein